MSEAFMVAFAHLTRTQPEWCLFFASSLVSTKQGQITKLLTRRTNKMPAANVRAHSGLEHLTRAFAEAPQSAMEPWMLAAYKRMTGSTITWIG